MNQTSLFADALEVVDRLSTEEQEALIAIVRRRVAEQGRNRVVAEAMEALREYEAGRCQTTSVDDLMNEILS